jgi:hypothetical protein
MNLLLQLFFLYIYMAVASRGRQWLGAGGKLSEKEAKTASRQKLSFPRIACLIPYDTLCTVPLSHPPFPHYIRRTINNNHFLPGPNKQKATFLRAHNSAQTRKLYSCTRRGTKFYICI